MISLRWPSRRRHAVRAASAEMLRAGLDYIDPDACVLHMASPTHYANLMIRYMVATKLAGMIPSLRISNIDLPYWNICCPEIPIAAGERYVELRSEQHFQFERIEYLWRSGVVKRFEWLTYGQRMENFPNLSACRALFQADPRIGRKTSDDHVLCPVRGAEILDAIHPGYTVVPIAFYEDMIEQTGLTPIFMGQTTGDNFFVKRLRERFRRAEFIPHKDPLEDFQTIRKARNIILPVSTFAWLAAWLSDAATIIQPVFGIFNPNLFSLDLLPTGDGRYRFYQFPDQAAVPLDQLEDAHARIKGRWHEVPRLDLAP